MGNCVSKKKGRSQVYSVDDISTTVGELRDDLLYIIQLEYGFLDRLLSQDVLTFQQIQDLRNRPKEATSDQIGQLLDYVMKMSSQQKQQFLAVLDQTGQRHVINYIKAHGHRSTTHSDDWPLFYAQPVTKLKQHWPELKELLDCRNGLLDHMLSVGCINKRQKESIETGQENADKNERLLNILLRKSIIDYEKFIDCLLKTKQCQVASLVAPEKASEIHPLTEEVCKRLDTNHESLIDLIDTKHGLLNSMYAVGCITRRQKEFIEIPTSRSECNARLLDIIRRGSEEDFQTFIECLTKTKQQNVCQILLEDGVVACTVANISGIENEKQEERRIVDQFELLLTKLPNESRKELRERINKHIDDLISRDVNVVAMDIGDSIHVFYFCKSSSGFEHLHALYVSQQLKLILQQVFRLLLKRPNDSNLYVDTLVWPPSNYDQCSRYFGALVNPTTFRLIDQLAEKASCHNSDSGVSSEFIELLPFELIELILLKSAGQLFVVISRMTSRAAVYTLATLSAVSLLWWRTMSYGRQNSQKLKKYFMNVCHPLYCSPSQLAKFSVQDAGNAAGVAELSGRLYVACTKSGVIQVFESKPPFDRIDVINVDGLISSSDITACSITSQLYVADIEERAIWRVNVLSVDKLADKFISTKLLPYSLSINAGRLLITPRDGDALFIFGDDGNEVNRVPLPRFMLARHAVETNRDTYIVSYSNRWFESSQSEQDSVSEVDVSGQVVRRFSKGRDIGPVQFNRPRYLALVGNSDVVVADRFNECIVLLDSGLQFKRVLLESLGQQPDRLCFIRESGLVFVTFFYSADVHVYRIERKSIESTKDKS
jgi:hypothetical protein